MRSVKSNSAATPSPRPLPEQQVSLAGFLAKVNERNGVALQVPASTTGNGVPASTTDIAGVWAAAGPATQVVRTRAASRGWNRNVNTSVSLDVFRETFDQPIRPPVRLMACR